MIPCVGEFFTQQKEPSFQKSFLLSKKEPSFQKSFSKETIVAFTTFTPVISNDLIAFAIPTLEEEKERDFVLEPLLDKEKTYVWVKQVLISFSLTDKLFVFLGTFLTIKSQPKKVKGFFPCYPITMPLST